VASRLLEELQSDDFMLSVGYLVPPKALRVRLRSTPRAARLATALAEGELTEELIRDFVSVLLEDLRKGERFPHELSLATLAVVLEERPTEFAEEFLRDLSRLRLAEMSTSIGVAQECRRHRTGLSETCIGSYDFPPPRSVEHAPAEVATADGRGYGQGETIVASYFAEVV